MPWEIEENPNAVFAYGNVYLQDFADRIQAAVLAYYANSLVSTCVEITTPNNILQENVVVGIWSSDFGNYNCYAYVLGREIRQNPGDIIDGRTHDDGPYLEDLNIPITEDDYLFETCADLNHLGYEVIYSGAIRPAVSVTKHHRLICFRMETTDSGDYHFMVLEEDGYWYHKPGSTNPLRYLYEPSSDTPWRVEGYKFSNGSYVYFYDDDRSYAGTVYYIEYTIPCEDYEYIFIGSGQHVYGCPTCEQYQGFPQFCRYNNGRCTVCGSIEPIIQQSIPNTSQGTN